MGPSRSTLGGSAKRASATACASSVPFRRHSCLSSSLSFSAPTTPPHSVRKTNSNAAAEKGTHEAHYLEAAAMWCDGSYAMRLPRSTS